MRPMGPWQPRVALRATPASTSALNWAIFRHSIAGGVLSVHPVSKTLGGVDAIFVDIYCMYDKITHAIVYI